MSEFDDIKRGLEEAIAIAEGHKEGAKEHRIEVPTPDVRALRTKLGLSQAAFADAFGVSLGTVRNWEQGRRLPRGPARILLGVIAEEPEVVRRVLDHLAA